METNKSNRRKIKYKGKIVFIQFETEVYYILSPKSIPEKKFSVLKNINGKKNPDINPSTKW